MVFPWKPEGKAHCRIQHPAPRFHDSTMAKADVGRRRATRGRWFVPPPTAEMTSTSAMERGMVGHGAMALIKKYIDVEVS